MNVHCNDHLQKMYTFLSVVKSSSVAVVLIDRRSVYTNPTTWVVSSLHTFAFSAEWYTVYSIFSTTAVFLFIYLLIIITPGVGIGIVDLGYERRLASQLGAHRAPSIIGLLNGRVTFFHQAVVREHLRQFVEDLLPHKLVEKVKVIMISHLQASRSLRFKSLEKSRSDCDSTGRIK